MITDGTNVAPEAVLIGEGQLYLFVHSVLLLLLLSLNLFQLQLQGRWICGR
jgi:hypothetical protein